MAPRWTGLKAKTWDEAETWDEADWYSACDPRDFLMNFGDKAMDIVSFLEMSELYQVAYMLTNLNMWRLLT